MSTGWGHPYDRLGDYTDATSEARVLAYRLDLLNSEETAADATVPTWLAAAPPTTTDGTTDPRWTDYLQTRHNEMANRIDTLAIQTKWERPAWLGEIGYGDVRVTAVRHVVAYRAVYEHSGDDALGPEPDRAGSQHDAWTAASRAIDASHLENDRQSYDGSPDMARFIAQLEQGSNIFDDYRGPTASGPARTM